MTEQASVIRANVERVRLAMAQACAAHGRKLDEVRLVAVTKYVSSEIAFDVFQAGCLDLGESRPQELIRKAESFASFAGSEPFPDGPPRWHLIGHLQRNKVKKTLEHASFIHSVDSRRLLDEIASVGAMNPSPASILLEVNISGEASKDGLPPEELAPLVDYAMTLPGVRLHGLMGMSGLDASPAAAQRQFALLRNLRDRCESLGATLPELSMGMSGDFPQAIAEGSTLIRVGSSLFEGLPGF